MTWDSNLQLSLAFMSIPRFISVPLFGHASEISAFSQMYNALQDSTVRSDSQLNSVNFLFALALSKWTNSTIAGTLTDRLS